MATENYYELLGVDKNATQDEIKLAYRKLAKTHHPDRGGDGELFARINQAYDTIGDPNKRHEYDIRLANPYSGFQSGADPFADLREQFSTHFGFDFGGFRTRSQYRQPTSNRSVRILIKLNATDVFQEQSKTVSFNNVNGTPKIVELKIPKGVQHNQTILYKGLGDSSIAQLPSGDLIVRFELVMPEGFMVDGYDVFTVVTVDCIEAMIGVDKQITNFDGTTLSFKIPKGVQDGTKLSLTNQGLPTSDDKTRGRLIIIVNTYILKELSDAMLAKLTEINTTLKGN